MQINSKRLVSVLNENQDHLNIRKIDLQFWDYLHDRAIKTFRWRLSSWSRFEKLE